MTKRLAAFLTSLLILGLTVFPALPTQAASATMSISPGSVSAAVGKTFTINVNINAGEAINAASGTVTYSTDVLQATSVSTSGTIFSFWTDYPAAGGSIRFGGGLPNPGHVGSGKLFSITFKVKSAGGGSISISSGSALANDGSGTNIYGGASGATVNGGGGAAKAPAAPTLSISSKSHPNQANWYKERTLSLSWNKPSDVSSFSYAIDSGASVTTSATSVTFDNLTDGSHAFRLTGKASKGDYSATYKAQIDNVAPEAFTIDVKLLSTTDPFPTFSYPAKDALSGIDHYVATIDGQEAKTTTESGFKADRQTPGARNIKVTAFDKAGNTTDSTTKFTIEGFPGPTITSVSRFVSVLQPITLKGTALAQTKVYLFVDGKKEAELVTRENLTDDQKKKADASVIKDDEKVEWTYTYKGLLLPGKHQFYAVQIKPDTSESNPSNTVESQVLWSSLSIGGLVLPMALIAILLLTLLIITLFLLIWLVKRSRNNTGTGSNWQPKLSKLKDRVDEDLTDMAEGVQDSAKNLIKKPKELKTKVKTEIEGAIDKVDHHFDDVIGSEKEDKPSSKK